MASSMGPPLPPGYSLRVQLFSPNAHGSSDKPIRCFRVVTSPDVTIREFCEEASRIHEINYGETLTVKKVQDDEGFDITQSEILGNLFTSKSVIRVVQASANPSVRDSVPPTSALRFDPTASRKRGREESVRPDGNAPPSSWKPNKRQRVSIPDPDEPLPSREDGSEVAGSPGANRRITGENIIHDSQESITLGGQKVFNTRQVREDLPLIPETPSPSPPPEANRSTAKKQILADTQMQKPIDHRQNDDSSFLSNADHSRRLREESVQAQANVPNSRAKSASYHIQRATERGTSVSTAATSPLSLDQRNLVENGTSSSKRQRPSPKPNLSKQNGNQFRSHNEDSTYENIVSEDKGAAILRKKKEALKSKNSPRTGPLGKERASSNLNTPPSGTRRTSATREHANPPGELPLTPNSEERKRQQQRKEADDAKKARFAATEAAEQRKREAEDARQAEETRVAEQERHQREEQERFEVEAFQRAETEHRAMIERAARLETEREQHERQEAEETRQHEEARIAREEAEEKQQHEEAHITRERRAEEARIPKEKQAEEERLARETAAAEESQRLREEEETIEREKQEVAAEGRRKAEAHAQKRAARLEEARNSKSASPIVSRGAPVPKPQPSSTSFFPSARKSSLKQPQSSQALRSSSPAISKPPSEAASHGVGIEDQLPLPNKMKRKVSFIEEAAPRKETPIKPPTRILPPKAATASRATTQKEQTSKPVSKGSILPPGRQSNTPIPVPTTLRYSSQERSTTPTAQTKISPSPKPTPGPVKRASASIQSALKQYGRAAASKTREKSKPVEQPPAIEVSSDDYSEEDLPNRNIGKMPSHSTGLPSEILSSNTTIKFEPKEPKEEDEDAKIDEEETQSPRDSRSPVIFSQHPKFGDTDKSQRAASPASASGSEEGSEDIDDKELGDDVSEDKDDDEGDVHAETSKNDDAMPSNADEVSESGSEDNDDDDEDEEEDEEADDEGGGPKVQVPKSSPPELPPHKQPVKSTLANAGTKPSQNNSKESSSDMGMSTQDEVDQQLTSSIYEVRSAPTSSVRNPIPASSAATKPRIGFGASLSSLNAATKTLASSTAAKTNGARFSSQRLQLAEEEEDSEEGEDESDEDDDTSSDEQVDVSGSRNPSSTTTKTSSRIEDAENDSEDFESESDSDMSMDGERTRQELLSQINAINSKNNGDNIPSPKRYQSSSQDATQTKKAPEKKGNKFLTGYQFSTPA